MKKKIFVTIIIAILALTLTACHLVPETDDTYAELNKMVKLDYQSVNMEVQTTMNGVTLVNSFTSNIGTNSTVVTYSVQELATFDSTDGSYVVPDNMIVKKTGTAVIKNGVIVEQNGDAVNIPVTSLENLTIQFKDSFFNMAQSTYEAGAYVFKADVTNVKGFTGNDSFDGTNMSVLVRYNEKLSSVVIDYTTSNGATVKVIYTFR